MGDSSAAAETDSSAGYSIRVVARLSGISADTLRMWERRYGFPKPQRTDSNVRLYSAEDVDKLILVARALKAGYRAGEVIRRDPVDLKQLLASSAQTRFDPGASTPTIQSLLDALTREQPDLLRSEMRTAVALLGPKRFLTEVAGPLAEQVGMAWASGRIQVRHEHLLSAQLSLQLNILLSAYEPIAGAPSVVLATLPGEQHGLGLDMAALYLAVHGIVPRVLGVDTPPDQIVEAAHALGASAVGLSVSASSNLDAVSGHLGWMLRELRETVAIWIGGRRGAALTLTDPRVHLTPDWHALDVRLAELKQNGARPLANELLT